jgi:glycosyltransferase involved in cell wall biosynthesis
MRVAIDALFAGGQEGGGEQVVMGLASGFSGLPLQGDRILFNVLRSNHGWIHNHVAPPAELVTRAIGEASAAHRAKNLLGPLRPILGGFSRAVGLTRPIHQPRELVSVESLIPEAEFDILHVTTPTHALRSRKPFVTTVFDLQHRHLPEIFDQPTLDWRECVYPQLFRESSAIITCSAFSKRDIRDQYGVPEERIHLIKLVAPLAAYGPSSAHVPPEFHVPERFALYPSVTYPHKNHIRLLEAVATLRDRAGLKVNVICTGARKHAWPQIRQRLASLQLGDQVFFPGYLPENELAWLFDRAHFLLFPSLFEGVGLAVVEAAFAGLPIVCSDIPPLREYAPDSAAFFDPNHVAAIADAIAVAWQSAEPRRAAGAGTGRTWREVAAEHLEVYRAQAPIR